MNNIDGNCEHCGDDLDCCNCDPDISKEAVIQLLVQDLVNTIKQWAFEDNDDEISVFIRENLQFDKLDYEDLYNHAINSGLI